MTIQICTNNSIKLDSQPVEFQTSNGLKHHLFVSQENDKTLVYSESVSGYKMPQERYTLSHADGISEFEKDLRNLILSLS